MFDPTPLKKLARTLAGVPKQADFAVVVALTKTAKDIQKEIKTVELPKQFALKNTHTARGIRITPATKRKIEATVYTMDWYMDDQDEGGIRKPLNSDFFWVPTKGFIRATGVDFNKKRIPKKFRPSRLITKTKINKNKPFMMKSPHGRTVIAVRRDKTRYPLDVLYSQVTEKKIKKRPFFQMPSGRIYDKKFFGHYSEAYNKFVLKKG